MSILGIDPGPVRSAYVILADGVPTRHETVDNQELRGVLATSLYIPVVIEKVESFGMAVGAEVFETVFWSGRFAEAAQPRPVHRIGRREVKLHLCGSSRAKDSNVRQALVDRFGGKDVAIGRKAAPGPLYGVSGDVWSALAVAATWADLHGGQER